MRTDRGFTSRLKDLHLALVPVSSDPWCVWRSGGFVKSSFLISEDEFRHVLSEETLLVSGDVSVLTGSCCLGCVRQLCALLKVLMWL